MPSLADVRWVQHAVDLPVNQRLATGGKTARGEAPAGTRSESSKGRVRDKGMAKGQRVHHACGGNAACPPHGKPRRHMPHVRPCTPGPSQALPASGRRPPTHPPTRFSLHSCAHCASASEGASITGTPISCSSLRHSSLFSRVTRTCGGGQEGGEGARGSAGRSESRRQRCGPQRQQAQARKGQAWEQGAGSLVPPEQARRLAARSQACPSAWSAHPGSSFHHSMNGGCGGTTVRAHPGSPCACCTFPRPPHCPPAHHREQQPGREGACWGQALRDWVEGGEKSRRARRPAAAQPNSSSDSTRAAARTSLAASSSAVASSRLVPRFASSARFSSGGLPSNTNLRALQAPTGVGAVTRLHRRAVLLTLLHA